MKANEQQKPNTMQAQANNNMAGGTNAFGDMGFGDTVSFSSKASNPTTSGVTSAGKAGGTMSKFANNDAELQQLAQELGVKADESAVKGKLQSMDLKALSKLDGEMLDIASDLGLISKADIDKKAGKDGNNNKPNDDDKNKIAFGAFSFGSEV